MLTCFPASLEGVVSIPASKSITQRALALALITPGTTRISRPGNSRDEKAALRIVEQLGATIDAADPNVWNMSSSGKINPKVEKVSCGESALSLRMFTPIASLGDRTVVLTGEDTLLNRRHDFPIDVFMRLGVHLEHPNNSALPVRIKGPLKADSIRVDTAQSSQYVTGLLFALAASALDVIRIQIENLVSRPYLRISVQMLCDFGYPVTWISDEVIQIEPRADESAQYHVEVEGDWSSAVFWMAAAALSGNITIKGLSSDTMQADRALLDILRASGSSILWKDGCLKVLKVNRLSSFYLNAIDCPDLVPIAAILAARAEGTSRISGIFRLRNKESDREKLVLNLLKLLGVEVYANSEEWQITGSDRLFTGGIFDAEGDHRMVMAAAIASSCALEPIQILGAEAVSKSYPDFFKHFEQLGGRIKS
jgi:3-phosphoshikimate 1-carboxyvinyltransferase